MERPPFGAAPEAEQVLLHPSTQSILRTRSASAARAQDPNTALADLFIEAQHAPLEVLQNPIMPLLALEDPARWIHLRNEAFLHFFTREVGRLLQHPELFYECAFVRTRLLYHLAAARDDAEQRNALFLRELWGGLRSRLRVYSIKTQKRTEVYAQVHACFHTYRAFAKRDLTQEQNLLKAAVYNFIDGTPTGRITLIENLAGMCAMSGALFEWHWWWSQLITFWDSHRRHSMVLDETKKQISALGCGDIGCVIAAPAPNSVQTSEGCWCIKAMGGDPRKANVARAFQLYRWCLDEYNKTAAQLDPMLAENAKLKEEVRLLKEQFKPKQPRKKR